MTTALEWVQVSAFYANLERAARAIRPNQTLTPEDEVVCDTQATYADDAYPVAQAHIARNNKEKIEVVEALMDAAHRAATEAVDHELGGDARFG